LWWCALKLGANRVDVGITRAVVRKFCDAHALNLP